MNVTWLIEQDVFEETQKIMEIVHELGMKGVWFKYPGFDQDIEHGNYDDNDCIFVYGSINASMYFQRNKPWIPGVWCNFKELRCSNYLSYWGKYSLQQNYAFMPFAEVYRRKDWIYKVMSLKFGQERLVFIRPDDNAKSFHGELVAKEKFEDWYRISNIYEPGKQCMTLVSEPSKIEAEYRFVIADKKVVTGSQYRLNGKLAYLSKFPIEAANLAEEIANSCEFNPHPMYIMDICKTEDGYKLMEIGSANCAGMYACDLVKFVEKASELSLAEWEDMQPFTRILELNLEKL